MDLVIILLMLIRSFNLGRTLPHEIGHCFGLFHIWGDESGCANSDFRQLGGTCVLPASLAGATGDQTVGDTPNQAGATGRLPFGLANRCMFWCFSRIQLPELYGLYQ